MRHYTTLKGDRDLAEIVAQAIFNAQYPLRTWDGAKEYVRKTFLKRARRSLELSGFADAKLVKGDEA